MVALAEKALAKSIAMYHDKIRGVGCQGVNPPAHDQNADLVPQGTVLHRLPLRPRDGAASVEMEEHANHDGA